MSITITINIEANSFPELQEQLRHKLVGLVALQGDAQPPEPVAALVAAVREDMAEALAEAVQEAEAAPAPTLKPEPELAPRRKRRPKAETAPPAEPEGEPSTEMPAPGVETPTEVPAKSAAEAAEVLAPAVRTVASWSEAGQTFNLTRDEVIDVARTFIASHPGGPARGAAVIKGISGSLGYGKLSDLPDELMQDALDAINEAKA